MEKLIEEIITRARAIAREKGRATVLIDGRCASGKSTLGAALAERLGANLFHMDDFFLPFDKKTPERLGRPGENVDHERFLAEVLTPHATGKPFSYRPFDCKTFTLSPPVSVPAKKLNIIEGSYCLHPYFGDPYDLKILLTVSETAQELRILQRPEFLRERFRNQWIPMENRYLEHFRIAEKADLIL